ncbi:AAA family ATPase [Cereibacter sphaeroides]|uniref:AAA family ATPase n=1 Tax=Cereibacter sphaeroides TaxID=1063 RepID=UPI001F433794|nr:AAA family ATPase [Cereibacter sphaeroides]MCE6958125.1 AAA family ATPase [Cereibacter sphaeroides]MCE6971638.1 AAA family ATPase [Cereibacter sphaeroides]
MTEPIPAAVPVDVYFAKSIQDLEGFPTPVIAVIPDRDNPGWNDFGRNFFANLYIRPAEGDPLNFHMRVMFKGRRRSSAVFDEIFAQHGNTCTTNAVEQTFVTLLPDVEMYRDVIGALGFDVGISALRMMHDATVARTEGNNPELLELIGSEDFHFGALRVGAAYDALRRGGRYFRPDPPQPVEELAANFVFSAQLPSAENPYTLPFYFKPDPVFRNRIAVLIGRNGVGKTHLLKAIVDSLHNPLERPYGRQRFMPRLNPSRVIVFSSVPTDPFPQSIGAWRGIDYEYYAVNSQLDNQDNSLLAALVTCRKADEMNVFGHKRNKSRMDIIKEALSSIGLWKGLHLPVVPQAAEERLPHVVLVGEQSYFPIHRSLNEQNSIRLIHQIDWDRSAAILTEHGQVRRLSSGEHAMMRFAAQAASAVAQGSLILLDEPETHLHPNFISNLMGILDNLLQSTGSIAIVATHSAYVARETPRNCVHVLTMEGRQIRIDPPRIQTFGATIDSISQFVFGDLSISHSYQKTLIEWTDRTGRELGIEGILEKYGDQLNSESLSFIARRLAEPPGDEQVEGEPEA